MTRTKAIGVLIVVAIAGVYSLDFLTQDEVEIEATDWIFLGVVLVVAIVFWWVEVLHTLGRSEGNTPAMAGLICSIIGAAGLVRFWTAVPLFVGAGGLVLGLEGYERSKRGEGRYSMAVGAILIGGLAVGAWIPVFIFG